MSQLAHHWLINALKKVVSLFSGKEVKTPLAAFDRQNTKVMALATLGLLLARPDERVGVLIGAGVLLFIHEIIMAAFTWYRPQNLVFGESGYLKPPSKPANSASSNADTRNRPAA